MSVDHIYISGGRGYVGSHIVEAAYRLGVPTTILPRDPSRWRFVNGGNVWLVNAAGFTGANVDHCAARKMDCIESNLFHAITCATRAANEGLRLLHVSTGCIFSGPKFFDEGSTPNFTFNDDRHSFYTGIKYEAENRIQRICKNVLIARIRMPYDDKRHHKNLLHRILQHEEVWDFAPNSMTYMPCAAVSMVNDMESGVTGVFHYISNDGLSNRAIIEMAVKCGLPAKAARFIPPGCIPPGHEPRSIGVIGSCLRNHFNLAETAQGIFEQWAKT